MRVLLVPWLMRFAARLRFPQLFALVAALFAIDLLVPDALPLVDELILGLGTLLLASLRRRDADSGSDRATR